MSRINSKTILFLIISVVTCFVFYCPIPEILSWDIFGHYIYLPLAFENHQLILHDMSYPERINEIYQITETYYQFVETEGGTFFTKYTSGWAILQLPFYLIAELWAHLTGVKADGFTWPYQFMMYFGAWFYAICGLIFTRKILLHFFTDRLTAFLLIVLVFSTNLLFMFYGAAGQSNLFAFFLVSVLVWRVICYYKNRSSRNAVWLGATWGLLILVRPPDGILGLLIFLWEVNSVQTFKESFIRFFKTERTNTIRIVVALFITVSPQLIYWYFSTGSILLNSYANNNGEGFDFANPYLFEFLFSFKKGWLVYTPLMIFAFLGAVVMLNKSVHGKAVSIVAFIFLYVISSWTCWWYGAGFSSRAAVDMYPLCIVLIGFFVQKYTVTAWRIALWVSIGIFTVLNLVQTYQISYGILNLSFMTKEYYFETFFQFSKPSKVQKELLGFDRERMYREGYDRNYTNYVSCQIVEENFTPSICIDSIQPYAKELYLPVDEYIKKSHVWIKVTWKYKCELSALKQTIFYVSALYKKSTYAWQGFTPGDLNTAIDTAKNEINFFFLSPNIRTSSDRLMFGVMNHSNQPVILLRRRIEFLEPIVDY